MSSASPIRRLLAVGAATAAVLASAALTGPAAAAAEGTVLSAGGQGALTGQYIVALRDTASVRAEGVAATATSLAQRYGGTVGFTYRHALRGFSVRMSEAAARQLAANPAIDFVEQDHLVTIADTQTNPPSWGLDRIDQRNRPLDNSYTFNTTASNVHAYIIDTGVRITHTTFGGRAVNGFDAVDNDNVAQDGNGHGTHVAGTVGGSQYGVAKGVTIHAVRVLNNAGSGTTAQVVAGIDWVTGNAIRPAVANMSLGGGANTSIDTAVSNSINSGVSYAIAAGNSNANACNSSPARVAAAITVGATDINDNRASFSNFGTCLDIFAPGVSITSSWNTSDTATNTISGTSMATPHVAGAAALILAGSPTASPATVRNTMVGNATSGVVANPGTGSPNLLLFTVAGSPPPPGVTVFSDDFELARGWTTNPNGTDTATTGQWQRADPAQTASGTTICQLGTTTSGVNDLVTGATAGASVGDFDIDGGTTSVQSPAITLPSSSNISLSFNWYLGHLNNASSADFIRVQVVGSSGTTTVFQQLGAATNRSAAWSTATVSLNGFSGQTIRLLVSAADASTASLVEAGVDDVRITA